MKSPKSLGLVAVFVPLFAILAAAGWYAARAYISVAGPPMPAFGYFAMALGVVLSVGVGCGLMALLFYSARHGYDEPFQPTDEGGAGGAGTGGAGSDGPMANGR